jgi:hypothetical protein
MSRICQGCGYWIDYSTDRGAWTDEHDDDACYDNDLNLMGLHKPIVPSFALYNDNDYDVD